MKITDEMKQQLTGVKEEVRALLGENKVEEAEVKMEEVRALEKKISLQEELDKQEEREVETKIEKRGVVEMGKVEVRDVFVKAIKGGALNEEERALVQASVDTQGGYLVPKEISNSIGELKRQYKSAKELVEVIPTGTEKGSFVIEELANVTQLINFDEDNTGLAEQTPTFKNIEYAIKNYGAITPISNSLLQDEAANLLGYITSTFAKKAVKTENAKIFAALKTGKVAKVVTDVASLKNIVNIDLDPAIKDASVIAMNQDAYAKLDEMDDTTGRPLLQPDPTNATAKTLFGLPVHVFSNKELPSVANKAGIFIGSLKDGVKFFDRGVYEVALSKEANFTKNQTTSRCIERFDVVQGDADAYVYAEIDVTPAV